MSQAFLFHLSLLVWDGIDDDDGIMAIRGREMER
jgi:hypothetical protein